MSFGTNCHNLGRWKIALFHILCIPLIACQMVAATVDENSPQRMRTDLVMANARSYLVPTMSLFTPGREPD
jgi:hypothetical protein